jgi:sortase A
LVIAKIGVDAPIIAGDSWEDLKKGVGHHPAAPIRGKWATWSVSAHNDVYGEIFRDLDKLQSGDEVLVYTDAGAFPLIVNRVEIVARPRSR